MPRKGNITFVPAVGKGGSASMPLDLIPDDIKREVEEVYAALKTATGRMTVEYDTEDEVKDYRRHVEAYCKLRPTDVNTIKGLFIDSDGNPLWIGPDGKPAELNEDGTPTEGSTQVEDAVKAAATITTGGPLKFRASPVRDAPKTQLSFRISDIPPADPATTEIRSAVQTVTEDASVAASGATAPEPTSPPTATDAAKVVPSPTAGQAAPVKATGRKR